MKTLLLLMLLCGVAVAKTASLDNDEELDIRDLIKLSKEQQDKKALTNENEEADDETEEMDDETEETNDETGEDEDIEKEFDMINDEDEDEDDGEREKKVWFRRIRVRLPRVRLPRVRFPRVRLPRVRLPRVRLPRVRLPRIRIRWPRIRLPRISLHCTRRCAEYNWCRIKGLTFKRCYKPYGCVCSRFAWETGK